MQTTKAYKGKADPQNIKTILDHDGLTGILHKAKRLLTLQQRIEQVLDAETIAHCHVFNIENNQLILGVDNAAWATRLRYDEAELIHYLQQFQDSRMLQFVVCKVRPQAAPITTVHSAPKRHLSQTSSQLICDIASGITNPELRSALMKLGQKNQ